MATYTVAANEVGAYTKTLGASTVSEWDFADSPAAIEIFTDATADVFYTIGPDNTPGVGANTAHLVPKLLGYRLVDVGSTAHVVVKLVSAGTPVVSVARFTGRDVGH